MASEVKTADVCEDCGCKLFETYLGGDVPERSHVCCVRCGHKRVISPDKTVGVYHHYGPEFGQRFNQLLTDAGVEFGCRVDATVVVATLEQHEQVTELFNKVCKEFK